jgi:excisionase family DNA binding protein
MMAAMNAAPAAAPGGVPPAISAQPELLGTADVARMLGVSEADVMSTLEKGELKGKKIGSTWRVTKAALDEFLKS